MLWGPQISQPVTRSARLAPGVPNCLALFLIHCIALKTVLTDPIPYFKECGTQYTQHSSVLLVPSSKDAMFWILTTITSIYVSWSRNIHYVHVSISAKLGTEGHVTRRLIIVDRTSGIIPGSLSV